MEITILGGGLSGLSAAYHLNDRLKYTIYEKEDRVGGLCRSIRQDGFTFDIGPHLLFSKDLYFQSLVSKLLGDNLLEKMSNAGQHSIGTYVGYPYTVNMYGLPVEVIKKCLIGFIEVLYRQKEVEPSNYEEWCYYNFGKGFAELFMFPYARKIWTVEPSSMTTDWIGKRIVLPALEQVIDGALHKTDKALNYITTFKYPSKDGIQALINCFVNEVGNIICGKKVIEIDIKKKKIFFSDNTCISYEKIISTIPLPELSWIIKDIPTDIKDTLNKLCNNSVYIVNLGLKSHRDIKFQWIYYDSEDVPFYRIHFPTDLSSQMAPEGMFSVSAEISYSKFKPLKKEEALDKTIESLIRTGIIETQNEIVSTGVFDVPYAYVIYDLNRAPALKIIFDYLRKNNIYPCGRFGEWAYLWMDQSILSGKMAAEKVSGQSK